MAAFKVIIALNPTSNAHREASQKEEQHEKIRLWKEVCYWELFTYSNDSILDLRNLLSTQKGGIKYFYMYFTQIQLTAEKHS